MLDDKKFLGIFDPVEAWLFIATAGLFILRLVWGMIPALPDHSLWTIGWMVVPVVWMIDSAKHFGEVEGRVGFTYGGFCFGLGFVAAALSCVFMWTDSSRTPLSMVPVYIGAVVLGALLTLVFVMAMKKFGFGDKLAPITLAIVAVVSIVAFGTGATRSLNDVLPAIKNVETTATVISTSREHVDGVWNYTAKVDVEGTERVFSITDDDFGNLEKGSEVIAVDTTSLLGCKFESLKIKKPAA